MCKVFVLVCTFLSFFSQSVGAFNCIDIACVCVRLYTGVAVWVVLIRNGSVKNFVGIRIDGAGTDANSTIKNYFWTTPT